MDKKTVWFESSGTRCAAWYYLPEDLVENLPCVVMAHGFSAVKDQRLDAYAEYFCKAGLAVFLFDYQNFGESEGEPRQMLTIKGQLGDWQAAIDFVGELKEVDKNKVALWGTSLAGGHVQVLAADNPKVAAVVSQVPFCDGLKNLNEFGILHSLRALLTALVDKVGSLIGFQPLYIRVSGDKNNFAAIINPEVKKGYEDLSGPNTLWQNKITARSILAIPTYRPLNHSKKIKCPILYTISEPDYVLPAKYAHQAAEKAQHAEVKTYRCEHFEVYHPPLWHQVVKDQAEFLLKHLN